MENVITKGEEEAFQSEIEYRNAQNKFLEFMKYAEAWQKLEFISSILGMISLVALMLIAIFCSQIVESIILSSVVMDEYNIVSPSQTCAKTFTLPPMYFNNEPLKFQPQTLSAEYCELKDAVNKQKMIIIKIFKKCTQSSLPRVCFPLYPFSMHTDIFLEVVNILKAEAMWAHFATVAVYPLQLWIS